MVHVKKCPVKDGRGRPSTEWYKDGKPMIYCYGWIDRMNDEPIPECKNCPDYVYHAQDDLDAWLAEKDPNK